MISQGVPGSWLQNLAAWVLQASKQRLTAPFVYILMHNTRVQSYKIGGELMQICSICIQNRGVRIDCAQKLCKDAG